MLRVVVRVRNPVKRAADYCLGLAAFGSDNSFQGMVAGHVYEATHEVDEVSPLQEQLRQPGVVVVLRRNMTVGTGLGFGGANRMRHVSVEGLAGKAFHRSRLLLRIDPLPVLILRTY